MKCVLINKIVLCHWPVVKQHFWRYIWEARRGLVFYVVVHAHQLENNKTAVTNLANADASNVQVCTEASWVPDSPSAGPSDAQPGVCRLWPAAWPSLHPASGPTCRWNPAAAPRTACRGRHTHTLSQTPVVGTMSWYSLHISESLTPRCPYWHWPQSRTAAQPTNQQYDIKSAQTHTRQKGGGIFYMFQSIQRKGLFILTNIMVLKLI